MKKILLMFMVALVASSCVPITPQTRINQHPEIFAALPQKERDLVQRGELAKGMSPDAVMLAWGPPSMRFEGYHQGRASMRWDYTGATAVYSEPFYGIYGGYGIHGGHGYYGHYPHPYSAYAFGFAPELTYVPYRRASVWFVNNQVDGWERLH